MKGDEGTALLAAAGLRKRFGALVVLNGVDLTLGAGDAIGIVGPNGAGKTTLLSVFAGSQRLDAGTIHFRGVDVTSAGAAARCRLGIARAHQVPKPFGGMTVFENVLVGASAGGRRRRRDAYRVVVEVLELCELDRLANRTAESLGLLHRKRLELARALATEPSLLLLDEVMAGLNATEIEAMVRLVTTINAGGISVLLIEHNMRAVMALSHRIVVLSFGEKIASGTPREVAADRRVIEAYLGEEYVHPPQA